MNNNGFRNFGILAAVMGVLTILVNLGLLVAVCFIVYFFLVAGGIAPPIDYIPTIPNI